VVATPQDPSILARVTRLEQALKNLTQKGPIDPLSFVGRPHYTDGTPMRFFEVNDDAGNVRLAVWDISDADGSAVHGRQQVLEYDINGNLVRSQDLHGGWAEPWFAVPMRPAFIPNGAPASYSSNGYGFSYWNFSTTGNGIASGNVFWEGRIPYVSHPRLSIDGTWGQAAGSLTAITYSLTVGSLPAFTWSGTPLVTSAEGPFDISTLIRSTDVAIKLAVSWTGSGSVAADVLGCFLRQT
jgi:hypothetical protein